MKKKIYLVDVSAMYFRAFYAIRELNNSKGLPTNALYGFLSMTVKLMNKFKPENMVYCLDRKEATFRKDLDPNYKANRSDMPEELIKQVPYISKLIDALGIPRVDRKGYEADDVIGSIASWAEKNNYEAIIVSSDKDFAQIISGKTSMYNPVKSFMYTPEEVYKRWEVYPEQFIDYLAIIGDASDNVPGVKGIGPKGAVKLLTEFKTLDGVYENLETLKGATLKKLTEFKDQAYLSKELVTIITDLDLVKSAEDVTLKGPDIEELEPLLEELEFESFMKHFKKENSEEQQEEALEFTDVKVFENLVKEEKALIFLKSEKGEFIFSEQKVYKAPYEPELLEKVGAVSVKENVEWSGFGLKGFVKKLNSEKITIKADLQLKCYSLSSDDWSFEKACEHFNDDSVDVSASLNSYRESYESLDKRIKEDLKGKFLSLYERVEFPLLKVLLKMEKEGVLLDDKILDKQSCLLEERISKITHDVHAMVEDPFNLASPKQLSKVLFETLGLTPIKKTKTGFSTKTDVLEKLKSEHPICEKIIEFRELSKLKSTYVDALPRLINKKTKRIHTTYRQALTTTGRLSSVSPNLQNIPIKTEEGRKIRKAFVAKEGYVLLSADYSQIELRILAHISKDKGLTEAFLEDQDVHSRTAAEVFNVALDEVTTDQRRAAKAVNFGIAYGQGAYGLSETLGISRKEAKEIIENYFEKFSGVKTYIEETTEQANESFSVDTLLGRKREIKELKSSNKMLQKFGERAAINAPIQGSASDFIKMAMIEVDNKLDLKLLMQVHDELIFEVKKEEVGEKSDQIKEIMESVYQLSVPLKVNIGIGDNWDEAH